MNFDGRSGFCQLYHIRDLQSLTALQEVGFHRRIISNELVGLSHEALNLGPVEYLEAKVHPRSVNVNLITGNETFSAGIEEGAQQVACSVHPHQSVPSIPVYSTGHRLSDCKARRGL